MKTWFSAPGGLTIRRMRPCAIGLRRKATSLCPGRIISDTKLPRPCRWRASSLRWIRAPIPCVMLALGAKPTRPPPTRGLSRAVVALWRLCRHGKAIVVERVLGDPEPKIGIGQELLPRLVDQFEIRASAGQLVVGLERGFVTCVQNRTRKLPQLDAGGHQPAQRLGVSSVVLRHHQNGRLGACGFKGCSIRLRQSLPMLEIDEQRELTAAFP